MASHPERSQLRVAVLVWYVPDLARHVSNYLAGTKLDLICGKKYRDLASSLSTLSTVLLWKEAHLLLNLGSPARTVTLKRPRCCASSKVSGAPLKATS